jgi:HNH endonuclease
MRAGVRDVVRRRAGGFCEYCLFPEEWSRLSHHVEHIVARQHGGDDDTENLALACHRCNLRKGPNLSGVDPATLLMTPLFHPRRDRWAAHFVRRGLRIEGLTPIGRATVQVLALNDERRIELRAALFRGGQNENRTLN